MNRNAGASTPPAGWLRDEATPGTERWWDGTTWTQFTRNAGTFAPAPSQAGSSGLAVSGLVLAFLVPPLGALLSLAALLVLGKSPRKGRGLAVAGLLVGLVLSAATVVAYNYAVDLGSRLTGQLEQQLTDQGLGDLTELGLDGLTEQLPQGLAPPSTPGIPGAMPDLSSMLGAGQSMKVCYGEDQVSMKVYWLASDGLYALTAPDYAPQGPLKQKALPSQCPKGYPLPGPVIEGSR